MDEALEEYEEACDDDTPLKFRPLMFEAIKKLRKSLAYRMDCEFLPTNVDDGASRNPEFSQWTRNVVFPVKRRRSTRAGESDSPEF